MKSKVKYKSRAVNKQSQVLFFLAWLNLSDLDDRQALNELKNSTHISSPSPKPNPNYKWGLKLDTKQSLKLIKKGFKPSKRDICPIEASGQMGTWVAAF